MGEPLWLGEDITPLHPVDTPKGYLSPDLLRFEQLGAAEGWRGHIVRGFFRIMQAVSGV